MKNRPVMGGKKKKKKKNSNGSGSTLFTTPSGVAGPVRPHRAPHSLPACAAAEIKRGGGWRRSRPLRPGARALILFAAAQKGSSLVLLAQL